jgi:arginine deiminase
MTKNKIEVHSEIDPLKRVLVHRPDNGTARISPKQAEDLLFDDIVYLPRMQEEHDVFVEVLEAFLGPGNVMEMERLLCEALNQDEAAKQEMLEMIVQDEELPSNVKTMLEGLSDEALTQVLITGYYEPEDYFLFHPIPNFIFTRDIAFVVNDHLVITKAAKEARSRENFLTRFIIWAHPIFQQLQAENKVINLNKVDLFPPSKRGEPVYLEGGDAMLLHRDFLLIGASERTTPHAIRSLAQALFERGVVKNVVQVNIPNDRSFMHLDTIFTQINEKDFVCYKPIVYDGMSSNLIVFNPTGREKTYLSVKDFIHSEICPDPRFLFSGHGESPYQEREQWTDGCNLVALRPGVAITYDRNPRTERSFKEAGYRVVHAYDLLKAFKDGIILPQEVKNTIITLPSSELSRARGGSHCMTCPIERS